MSNGDYVLTEGERPWLALGSVSCLDPHKQMTWFLTLHNKTRGFVNVRTFLAMLITFVQKSALGNSPEGPRSQ